MKRQFKSACYCIVAFAISACVSDANPQPSLKSSSVKVAKQQAMVVTANPLASKAGADILRAGGSAVDASIAIASVLSLVEPQSSGLAGGAFMVHYDNQSKQVSVYDGRETAPAGIDPEQFLNADGKSMGYIDAKNSGLSTGVPGMVSMLELAHKDHGDLPWGVQFDAAANLAEQGFEVSPRLHYMINRFARFIPKTLEEGPVDAYEYFYDDQGAPLAEGAILKNPEYAKTLKAIAQNPRAFYEGDIAQKIVEQVKRAPRAGSLELADLQGYQASKRTALCSPYKGRKLCGPPPPSSWMAVGQIMGLLESGKGFDQGGADSAANWVTFAEAQRLAYADRDHYVGDSEFVSVPLEGMLNADYWAQRVKQAGDAKASIALEPGDPWQFQSQPTADNKVRYGKDSTQDVAGTSHFVVVDGSGDVVSVTASVESIFGSTRMAGGMFLNNQLTDFARNPKSEDGKPLANRIEPNKRPRSSMSPTIVLDKNNEFLLATGSPGGNSIIAYTAKTLIGVFDWGLTPQQAADLPNLVARGERVRIEKDRASEALISGLKEYGFNVRESAGENSGLSLVLRKADGSLEGGADTRREGTVEVVDF